MTQFEKANEYFLNKQYEEAYQIYSSGNDRYSRFNTALMEVFGRGIPQDLQKAKEYYEGLINDERFKDVDSMYVPLAKKRLLEMEV